MHEEGVWSGYRYSMCMCTDPTTCTYMYICKTRPGVAHLSGITCNVKCRMLIETMYNLWVWLPQNKHQCLWRTCVSRAKLIWVCTLYFVTATIISSFCSQQQPSHTSVIRTNHTLHVHACTCIKARSWYYMSPGDDIQLMVLCGEQKKAWKDKLPSEAYQVSV